MSSSRSNHLAHAGIAHAQALTSGYHLAFLIAAALIVAAIVVAAVVVQSDKHATAATARAGERAYESCRIRRSRAATATRRRGRDTDHVGCLLRYHDLREAGASEVLRQLLLLALSEKVRRRCAPYCPASRAVTDQSLPLQARPGPPGPRRVDGRSQPRAATTAPPVPSRLACPLRRCSSHHSSTLALTRPAMKAAIRLGRWSSGNPATRVGRSSVAVFGSVLARAATSLDEPSVGKWAVAGGASVHAARISTDAPHLGVLRNRDHDVLARSSTRTLPRQLRRARR